jgi:membrane-bound serine protease (ClpP class)
MSAILPVNAAGLALIGLALALFIVDVFAPTHGILTGGGIVSFFLGALMLFDRGGVFKLSLAYIIPATVLTAAFFIFIVAAGLRAQFRPVQSGREAMVGKMATALSRIDVVGGKAFIDGEYWNAVSETPVDSGQIVEVLSMEGLTLRVKPKNQ